MAGLRSSRRLSSPCTIRSAFITSGPQSLSDQRDSILKRVVLREGHNTSDFISSQYNMPHTCQRGGRAKVIQKKEKDHNAQKYSHSLRLNRIYLSMPEKDTKILREEMERIGGRKRSGSEWEEKRVECIEKKKGIKPGEIFNEEKRTNEGLLMLQTLFNPPRLEPES